MSLESAGASRGARPRQVDDAISLLAFSLALGLLNILLDPRFHSATAFAFGVVLLTVMAGFTYAVATGHNWARITYTVLFIAGLPLMPSSLAASYRVWWPTALVNIVQTAVSIYALYLLFTKPGKDWFGRRMEPQKADGSAD
jgi:hypothetical protein